MCELLSPLLLPKFVGSDFCAQLKVDDQEWEGLVGQNESTRTSLTLVQVMCKQENVFNVVNVDDDGQQKQFVVQCSRNSKRTSINRS